MTGLLGQLSPNSVRGQLLIWLLGPLLLIGAFGIYDSYRTARTTADSVSDRVLSGSALAIAERVFVNDDNDLEVDIPYVALQMLTSSEDDRVFYKIETSTGEFVTGYRGLKLRKSEQDQQAVSFSDGTFRGEPIRIVTYFGAASSNTKSIGFRVSVAETTNARSAIARSILVRSLVRQTALILGAAVLIWFAVTRALRPLRKLELAVSRRSPEDVRPIEHQVPHEVQGLVFTINGLVSRFYASIKALENFTSNASHQFRTPLALIKTHLEVAAREKTPDKRAKAIGRAHTAVGEAERLMSQILLLARVNAVSTLELRSKKCNLSEVAREVCEEFVLQLSHQGRSDVDLGFQTGESIIVFADKTLVQEVIRNLVDNAVKHSGEAPKIDVSVAQNTSGGTITVRDYGKGFDSEESETQSKRGEGLGLSIVKEIVAILEGKLAIIKTTPPPGMSITATFKPDV